MTTPARRIRRSDRRRTFDLRATALCFGILAAAVTVLGFTARTAAAAVERRPAWAVVLGLLVTAALLAARRRRRGYAVKRAAYRAAVALDAATRTALDALEKPPAPAVPEPARLAPHAADVSVPAPRAGDADPHTDQHLTPYADPPAGPRGVAGAGLQQTVALVTTELPARRGAGAETGGVDYEALDPYEFEQAIAALCERDGCSCVEVVGGAGDLGADVLAVTPDGRRVVIQCKRYCATNRVGSEELQRFGGTCYTVHEADVAALVTTSDFTAPAVEYAEQCGIVCVDRQALQAWSDGTGPEPWAAADGSLVPFTEPCPE
ncbi:restriction endonuclease [Streptomyces sp. NPDC086766]|uniref:restriction endonuclease n=1 Tax=Streptomyces sp. NPDC086766 TaxID=3365754 RepID=UPI00382F4B61